MVRNVPYMVRSGQDLAWTAGFWLIWEISANFNDFREMAEPRLEPGTSGVSNESFLTRLLKRSARARLSRGDQYKRTIYSPGCIQLVAVPYMVRNVPYMVRFGAPELEISRNRSLRSPRTVSYRTPSTLKPGSNSLGNLVREFS